MMIGINTKSSPPSPIRRSNGGWWLRKLFLFRVLRREGESNRSSFDWCPTGPPHNAAELNRCLTSIVRRR
ncbi:hypothetical protein F5144DRAFT_363960 [Chaetomium tenue]|uniref:Uncharacterized protein n=1 Tax=Chaetomium tenue TaxID=1854479 RepID=A0ACB7P0Z0_9PEZI|nr:hypothetical protein F5144DRAFT_363960 [Chaetomium globosum]